MKQAETIEVFHNGKKICVRVRINARTKKMRLKIDTKKNEAVLVLSRKSLLKAGKSFAQSKADWLFNELLKLPEKKIFFDSMSLTFLGQNVALHHCKTAKRGVWLKDDIVWVCGQEAHFARRVRDFFKKEFSKYALNKARQIALELGVEIKKVTVKEVFSRWGSCTQSGHISLSWRLSLAPLFVIDYVIVHEVAHLKEMNHSFSFWKTVSSCCPEYKKAELWLKKNVAYLHSFAP